MPEPTIVQDVLVWSATTLSLRNVGDIALQSGAKLLDASGRVVMSLRPGPNDIQHIAPGVYFCRPTAGSASSRTAESGVRSAVRKVVIQR
ncbi:MAG: hypothetical protein JSU73_12700 [candidate division WOR-3 bacterium]|nr:MAG: hypothetical protein JSU73_12700 [candidate division WOR-3 bacterium]